MSLLNKFLISLLIILTFSCSLEVDKKTEDTGTVYIAIPNISPRFLSALREDGSRAYNIIDKLILTVLKDGDEEASTITQNFTINDDNSIALVLGEGKYTIKADIFNLKNSETEAVVSGEGTVTITPQKTQNLRITLIPNSPIVLEENKEVEITGLKHTEYVHGYNDEIVTTGEEYWYVVETSTTTTDFKITNPIDTFSPAILTVYDKDGKHKGSTNLIKQKISLRTEKGSKYFVSIVPVKVKHDNGDFYENTVSMEVSPLIIKPSQDNNNSIDTADSVKIINGSITSSFDSVRDVDYFKVDVPNAKALIFYYYHDLKISLIQNDVEEEVTKNKHVVITDKSPVIKVANIDSKSDYSYEIKIKTDEGSNDSNNSVGNAEAVASNSKEISSNFDSVLDVDYFALDVTNLVAVSFAFSHHDCYKVSIIQNGEEKSVPREQIIPINGDKPILKVANSISNSNYDYSLYLTTYEESTDGNNSIETAEAIPSDSNSISSSFDSIFDVDYFKLNITNSCAIFWCYGPFEDDMLEAVLIQNGDEKIISYGEVIKITDESPILKVSNKRSDSNYKYNYSFGLKTCNESTDTNNTIGDAVKIPKGNNKITVNFDSIIDVDYFELDVTDINQIALDYYYYGFDISIIQNGNEEEVTSNETINLTGNSLILKVTNKSCEDNGDYSIVIITFEESADNNNSIENAEIIPSDINYVSSHFDSVSDVDYFVFDVSNRNKIAFNYNDYRTQASIINNGVEKEIKANQYVTVTGESVIVKATNNVIDNDSNYTISMFPLEDDYETVSGNNSFSTATEIQVGKDPQNHSLHLNDEDYFKVDLIEGEAYEFKTFNSVEIHSERKLWLYSTEKQFLKETNSIGFYNGCYNIVKISYMVETSGTYYFKVGPMYQGRQGYNGNYLVEVTRN